MGSDCVAYLFTLDKLFCSVFCFVANITHLPNSFNVQFKTLL